jgi:coproporphyrinogen III oxidase-like Fe-S oxidoreductase
MISAAAAKNKPERCADIVNIWSEAGIICAQGIGIQSSNPEVLNAIKRKNIQTEKLMGIRENLRKKGASTYMELIWPLPGDTVQGFKGSVDTVLKLSLSIQPCCCTAPQ